jgi:peptide subunit release factor 1 (eRF1)
MISREDIRELAQFQFSVGENVALSFYFQPRPPQNKSHREEAIQAKDLVRNALREAEKTGKNGGLRIDLDRIQELASTLRGNQARAKAVFACHAQNFWREFDLPPLLTATQLFVNRRFHLKPLATLLGAQPRMGIVLVNRQKARLFDFRLEEIREREGLFHAMPRRGRGDGFAGYDGGRAERSIGDEVLRHFKNVAERIKDEVESGAWEKLVIGCQDEHWAELEPQLHPYVRQRLLGRFSSEVTASAEHIRKRASLILSESLSQRRHSLVREVIGQAKGHSRGVTGLRRVLRSLEMGEVQTLLIGDGYRAQAVECTGCGHLDAHMVSFCAVCGRATHVLEDVMDAVIPAAICRDTELFYVQNDSEFDRAGNVAALLRFRADERKADRLRAAS